MEQKKIGTYLTSPIRCVDIKFMANNNNLEKIDKRAMDFLNTTITFTHWARCEKEHVCSYAHQLFDVTPMKCI